MYIYSIDVHLVSLEFAFKEPDVFNVVLSNSSPGFVKLFQSFSLDIGYFVIHF